MIVSVLQISFCQVIHYLSHGLAPCCFTQLALTAMLSKTAVKFSTFLAEPELIVRSIISVHIAHGEILYEGVTSELLWSGHKL